ncbi:MAG: WGxxGxxG-CTERM domain-containing protein [Cyanobacteria bacterium J06638_28]
MSKVLFSNITGASLLALGLTLAPTPNMTFAQDSQTTEPGDPETAGENFEDAGDALQNAGEETLEGIDATGEAIEAGTERAIEGAAETTEDVVNTTERAIEGTAEATENAARDAAQSAEAAAERAELAADNAAEAIEARANWGWLGLLGLVGLFGLAGGGKKREVKVVEVPDPAYVPQQQSTVEPQQPTVYRQ